MSRYLAELDLLAACLAKYFHFAFVFKDGKHYPSTYSIEDQRPSVFLHVNLYRDDFISSSRTTQTSLEKNLIAYLPEIAWGGVESNTVGILANLERSSAVLTFKAPDSNLHDLFLESEVSIFHLEVNDSEIRPEVISLVLATFNANLFWICNWSMEDISCSRDLFLRLKSAKIFVVDQRSYDHQFGWIESYSSFELKNINFFIATNQRIFKTLMTRYNIERERIALIYPCLKMDLKLAPLDFEDDVFNHVFIGRFSRQKRLDRVLSLAQRHFDNGFEDRFLLFGTGEELAYYQAKHFNLRNVRFMGNFDLNVIQEEQSDLILLSDYEGLPMVVIEALSAGLPVFATDVGDLARLRELIPQSLREFLFLIPVSATESSVYSSFVEWRNSLNKLDIEAKRLELKSWIDQYFHVSSATSNYEKVFERSKH